jgi:hypothetical protein
MRYHILSFDNQQAYSTSSGGVFPKRHFSVWIQRSYSRGSTDIPISSPRSKKNSNDSYEVIARSLTQAAGDLLQIDASTSFAYT